MSLCDVCLAPLGADDIGHMCGFCYDEWMAYQDEKRDDEGDDDA